LFDAGIEVVDLRAETVDLIQQQLGEFGVVFVEGAGQSLDECAALNPQPSFGQLGEGVRVTFTGDQRLDHRPAGDAHHVGGDR